MKKIALGFIGVFFIFSFALANIPGFINTPVPRERYVEFDYHVRLNEIPPGANALNIWLPLMPDNEYQVVEETVIEPPEGYRITFDKSYDNKILHYALK